MIDSLEEKYAIACGEIDLQKARVASAEAAIAEAYEKYDREVAEAVRAGLEFSNDDGTDDLELALRRERRKLASLEKARASLYRDMHAEIVERCGEELTARRVMAGRLMADLVQAQRMYAAAIGAMLKAKAECTETGDRFGKAYMVLHPDAGPCTGANLPMPYRWPNSWHKAAAFFGFDDYKGRSRYGTERWPAEKPLPEGALDWNDEGTVPD
jgi:hypothetical protein